MYPCLREHPDGVQLALFVQPRASKNRVVGLQGDELKVRLTSPPVDGAANKLCIQFFSKLFKTPKSSLEIVAGETSRHKRLLVRGANLDAIAGSLEPEIAES
ncbi:MAG: YggU family protein [Desulfuromonas sp.]|nr:MAG: YggU family protein [Desulfuromonas sp.]